MGHYYPHHLYENIDSDLNAKRQLLLRRCQEALPKLTGFYRVIAESTITGLNEL